MPSQIEICANIIINDLAPRLKRMGIPFDQSPVLPEQIADMSFLQFNGVMSNRDIRELLDKRCSLTT